MGNDATAMNHVPTNLAADAEVESLARETNTPVELVQEIYTLERAKLESTARIKTYVPVLVHRYVKDLLRDRRASL
jgi:hypothetical protein